MNEQELKQRLQHAANVRLSGLRPDPYLLQRVLASAQGESEERPLHHSFRVNAARLRFATVLVAMLVLLAAIGLAAGLHFGVFDFMARIFGQSGMLPQSSQLVQSDLATLETEHAVITLSEAVYDGGNLRVVYSVRQKGATLPLTSEELNDEQSSFRRAMAADSISPWGCDWFYLNGTEYTMTSGSTGATAVGTSDGEALCYMDIYLASEDIAPTEDFQVSLPIIRRGRGDITTLDFTVKVGDMSPTAAPGLGMNGVTVSLTSASLSPVRAYVSLRIERNTGVSAREFDLMLADWRDAVLVDAQGNELAKLAEFQTMREDEDCAEYSFIFLPTEAAEAYIAPRIITDDDQWLVDMSQAIQVK